MSLEPDDRNIMAVHPEPAASDRETRSCDRCGDEFPAEESWAVDYRVDEELSSTYVVCPACALYLMPIRVTIDIARLQQHAGDPELEPVVRLVERVIDLRSEPPRRELRLRAADMARLGKEYEQHPVAVIQRLRDARIAVSL